MRLIIPLMLTLAATPSTLAYAAFNEPAEAAPVSDADYRNGVIAVKAENWLEAITHLESAAKRHTRSADVHNLLGYAYRKSNNLDRSFTHYQRALDLDPEHRGAHEYIGEAWLMRGDAKQARSHLNELARICRSDCEEFHDLAKAIAEFESRQRPR
jgi:tetratricopeptide (TPR) repeat protein